MKPASLSLPLLPITEHLEQIAAGIAQHPLSIIQAPPGSGKTTLLPLYLAEHPQFRDKKVLILQPRRLAARSVALRMASLINQEVGSRVGYQVRLERKISQATQIEVITEGLLTRRIVSEGELKGVGLIVFDEFHERSINADVGLALAREVANVLRPDLRVLVMSATLDTLEDLEPLKDAWRYRFESKPHPVTISYHAPELRKPIWQETARIITDSLVRYPGDLLAFLPGAGDIERCREALLTLRVKATVLPLYAELPYEEQLLAIEPNTSDERRVVLATNIAETSLTIEGVRIVVDSGLHKVARSQETGVVTLNTERISRDAADQRTGRAGRTAPGISVRLWSEQEHSTLRPAREPEVLRCDVSQTLLELAAWGVRDPAAFNWITPPSASAILAGTKSLKTIGALKQDGSISAMGEQLVRFGTHPRIGAMCVAAARHKLESYAAAIIPTLEERLPPNTPTDITETIHSLLEDGRSKQQNSRLKALANMWQTRIAKLNVEPLAQHERVNPEHATGYLLAVAFPERIARQREPQGERYLMASGRGCGLRTKDPLARYPYLVVAEIHDRSDQGLISRAAPLNPRLLDEQLKHLLSRQLVSEFDTVRGTQTTEWITKLGAIKIKQEAASQISAEESREALINFLRTVDGHNKLPFTEQHQELQARAAWALTISPKTAIPELSDNALRESQPFWLAQFLPKDLRLSSIKAQDITNALNGLLSWSGKRDLDKLAPDTFQLPSGKSAPIRYAQNGEPTLEVVIQHAFGLRETPLIGELKKPLCLHLLSPARRPMQVTRDLASFWRSTYPEVRKELRGRYPKHRWPEDPNSD